MIDLSEMKYQEAFDLVESMQIEGVVALYFTAPTEWLEDRYEDIVSTELQFEIYDKDTDHPWFNYIGMSPTRYNEEYDQYEDYDWEETEITRIIDAQGITATQILELARKGGYEG